jgi:hypothetical protein
MNQIVLMPMCKTLIQKKKQGLFCSIKNLPLVVRNRVTSTAIFFYLVHEAIGTAATPGLLCQPRVILKMIVEKQMERRLAGETDVLEENLT